MRWQQVEYILYAWGGGEGENRRGVAAAAMFQREKNLSAAYSKMKFKYLKNSHTFFQVKTLRETGEIWRAEVSINFRPKCALHFPPNLNGMQEEARGKKYSVTRNRVFLSLKIRRPMNFMLFKNTDRQILRLKHCELHRRALLISWMRRADRPGLMAGC